MPKINGTAFGEHGEHHFAVCSNCKERGPLASSRKQALKKALAVGWNRHINSGDNTCFLCVLRFDLKRYKSYVEQLNEEVLSLRNRFNVDEGDDPPPLRLCGCGKVTRTRLRYCTTCGRDYTPQSGSPRATAQ